MSARDPFDPADPELERALASVEPPRARAAFRAELRRRFVAGDAAVAHVGAPAAVPRPAAGVRRRVWSAAAALAAAGVLALLLWRRGSEPSPAPAPLAGSGASVAPSAGAVSATWGVLERRGALLVDDVPAGDDPGELERALAGAQRVATAEGGLRLRLADRMLIELGPRTEVVLGGCCKSSDGRRRLDVRSGAVRISTGPDFDGLSLATPDVDLEVTGTVFAVDVDEHGTCVCCRSGRIALGERASKCSHVLGAGELVFVEHADHAGCKTGAALNVHAAPLAELASEATRVWGAR